MSTQKNMLPRICRECGRSFLGGPRAWYCPECRVDRRKIHDKEFKERKRAGNVIPVGSIIKCEICGKEIIKKGGLQRYCEKCAAKHLKEVDNQQSLAWKKENPEKIKEAKRKLSKQRYSQGETDQSGVVGVLWDKGSKRWRAGVYFGGKKYCILQTKDRDLAISARKEAESIQGIDDINKLREKYKTINSKKSD